MIRVIVPLYNAEKYIGKCLASISIQTHKDWKCYICDDMSTDNSVHMLEKLVGNDNRFEIIKNTKKMYPVGNHYQVIHRDEIDDNDICISVDGDDHLINNKVFKQIANVYNNKDNWITYGSFVHWNGREYKAGFAGPPEYGFGKLRQSAFSTTHLRTFKAWLFRKIAIEDLKYNGEFFSIMGDMAFMYPMLEMAHRKHSRFLKETMYVYNIENTNNEFKSNINIQREIELYIRNMTPYYKLKE